MRQQKLISALNLSIHGRVVVISQALPPNKRAVLQVLLHQLYDKVLLADDPMITRPSLDSEVALEYLSAPLIELRETGRRVPRWLAVVVGPVVDLGAIVVPLGALVRVLLLEVNNELVLGLVWSAVPSEARVKGWVLDGSDPRYILVDQLDGERIGWDWSDRGSKFRRL